MFIRRLLQSVALAALAVSCVSDVSPSEIDSDTEPVAVSPQALTFSNCALDVAAACNLYGCGCIDGACNGGFCAGTGCTSQQTSTCSSMGCGCADGECAGGACAGSGCTPREISDCQALGQGCASHSCQAATATAIGATDGEFTVGQSGDASFTIPIQVVPGTAGVQPSLNFAYDSSGEDTVLGTGWMVSGVSQITRCEANLEQDGFVDPVDFDSNDRFCLDGQRLVAVNGPYGGDGTEYRTEIDSFARIVSYGNAPGGGPDRFVVQRKSGEVAGYGHTADSRVELYYPGSPAQSGPIVVWAINQLNDPAGNYLLYTYDENRGEHHVKRIDYGAPSVGSYADVRFIYEPRPDPIEGFQFGGSSPLTVRLKRVLTEFGASVARRYELNYVQSAAAGRSLLASLQECGADGSCLPATRFDTSAQAAGFDAASRVVLPAGSGGVHAHSTNAQNETLADLDGDGDLDRSWIPHGTVDVYAALWNGTSFDPPTLWLTTAAAGFNAFSDQGRYTSWTDLNGDGKADYVWIPFRLSDIYVALSTGTKFAAPTIWHSPAGVLPWSDGAVLEAYTDVNGDALPDRVFGRNGAIYVLVNNGNNSFSVAQPWLPTPVIPQPLNYSAGHKQQDFVDVNLDGRTDFVWVPQDRSDLYVALSNGTAFDPPTIWLSNASAAYRDKDSDIYVDMTGDGLPDRVVAPSGTSSAIMVSINTGKSFLPAVAWITGNESSGDPTQRIYSADPRHEQLVDLNDDNRTDRVWLNPITNTIWVTYSVTERDATTEAVRLRFGPPRELITPSVGVAPYAGTGPQEAQLREEYVDITGDGVVDKFLSPNGTTEFRVIAGLPVSHRLEKITNGFGYERRIEYATLLDPSVYIQDHDAVFPVMDANGAMHVVHYLHTSDGLGGFQTRRYTYAGLKMHLRGLGALGMRQTVEVDEPGIGFTVRTFSQDYKKRLRGAQLTDGRVGPGFVGLRATENRYGTQQFAATGGSRFVIDLLETTTTSRDLNGAFISKGRTQTLEVDGFGNILRVRKTVMDDRDVVQSQSDIVNSYQNDPASWSLALLTRSTVTQSSPAASPAVAPVTRVTEQSWDVQKRLLMQEVLEPNVPELRLVHQYTYDTFGNEISITTSGFDVPSRTSTTAYDATGRFKIRTQSAVNQIIQNTYDPQTGNVVTSTDVNNLVSTFEYDGLGRVVLQTAPDQTDTMTELSRCDSGCPANAVYVMRTTPEGGTPRAAYFDVRGRSLREETFSLEGKRTLVDRRYDTRGRNTQVSEPYFEGATPLWTTMTYDDLDRVTRMDNPNTTFSTIAYNGLAITMTNERGQTNIVTRNVVNLKTSVRDASGGVLTFRYDPFDNVIESRDPAGNITSIAYDRQGRKTSISDPDQGVTSYVYDAFGNVRRQTDAKLQVTELSYDAIGRTTLRVDNLGGTQQQLTKWTYDTAQNGKGELTNVKQLRCTGTVATCLTSLESNPEHAETYTYDALGRSTRVDTWIGSESFLLDTAYDGLGRVATVTYPDSAGQRLRVRYTYNALGYLTKVANDLSGQTLWTAKTTDARGNLTSFDLGNGLTTKRTYQANTGFLTKIETGTTSTPTSVQNLETVFDALGNLSSRRDARINFTETVTYDALNRMTAVTSKLGSATTTTATASYDALGNISARTGTGTGTYAYAKSCTGGKAGPHAVTSVTNGSLVTGYCYDNNGNMIRSGARTIEWAPFDKPTRFKNGSVEARFDYGPNRQRYRRVDIGGAAGSSTTVYVGGLFERVTKLTSTEYRNFIGDFAVYKRTVTTSTATATYYFHADHLGSVNAVTDSARAVVERFNFDPWGNRRAVSGEKTTTSAHTLRGFTKQEQIDDFKLVHMNGRVYDPTIGRFISADPFVQDPDNLQSLNRYSYVLNNPLSYTDPSGFFSTRVKKVLRGVRVALRVPRRSDVKSALRFVARAWERYPGLQRAVGNLACSTYIGCGFFAGFTAAVYYSAGASTGDALKGAALAFLSSSPLLGNVAGGAVKQITSRLPEVAARALAKAGAAELLGNAVAAGVLAEAQGGKFNKGFLSGVRATTINRFFDGLMRSLPGRADAQNGIIRYDSEDDDAREEAIAELRRRVEFLTFKISLQKAVEEFLGGQIKQQQQIADRALEAGQALFEAGHKFEPFSVGTLTFTTIMEAVLPGIGLADVPGALIELSIIDAQRNQLKTYLGALDEIDLLKRDIGRIRTDRLENQKALTVYNSLLEALGP